MVLAKQKPEQKTGSKPKTHLADFYVGIEGGCGYEDKTLYAFAWVVVENKKGRQGRGKTSMFQLPKIKDLIEDGVELGVADDIVFNRKTQRKRWGNRNFNRRAYRSNQVL